MNILFQHVYFLGFRELFPLGSRVPDQLISADVGGGLIYQHFLQGERKEQVDVSGIDSYELFLFFGGFLHFKPPVEVFELLRDGVDAEILVQFCRSLRHPQNIVFDVVAGPLSLKCVGVLNNGLAVESAEEIVGKQLLLAENIMLKLRFRKHRDELGSEFCAEVKILRSQQLRLLRELVVD